MYHHIFVHSSVDGHLSYFHVLAVINSTAMNIGVQVSLSNLVSSWYTPRSGIAGAHGGFIPSFLRSLHTVFHNGCISISCHQQCKRVPFPPTPSPAFIGCGLFVDGHSDWCEVVSHCGWAVKNLPSVGDLGLIPESERRAWQPTPVFLPGESNGQGSLEGFSPRVAQSQTWLKWLSSSRGNRLLDDGYSAWYKVVSHCSFDFYFYCGFLPNQCWQDSVWGLKVLLHLDCQADMQGTFQETPKHGK